KRGKNRFTGATVTLNGTGNSSNASSHDRNFFTLSFNSVKKKESLLAVTIDLTNADLKFDTTGDTGFPFTLGQMVGITAADVSVAAPADVESLSSIVLLFRPGSFKNGASLSFGIDRDFIGDAGGNT